jgi:multidrug/hemolysin transport system ATP-binding protein
MVLILASVLTVRGLEKSFDGVKAVDDLSFDVEEGALFAFLGQNGAGKSTTISILLGLLKADGGEIDYSGGGYAAFKRNVGVVFQNNVFDELMSVEENLVLYGRMYLRGGAAVKARYGEILEMLSLGDCAKKRFKTLSGGQKRKAEIARALLNAPRLLFLDEPTAGLDPKTRAEVWKILCDLRRETDMTIFLTTHYMEETADADKVVIIHKGKLIAEGSPAELKSRYSYDRLLITPADGGLLEKQLSERGAGYTRTADTYNVPMKDAALSIELLYALRGNIRFYEAVKGSMDDVFLNAVGSRISDDQSPQSPGGGRNG